MFDGIVKPMELSVTAELGLCLFVLVFLAVLIWAIGCSGRQMKSWSSIPLDSDNDLQPRE